MLCICRYCVFTWYGRSKKEYCLSSVLRPERRFFPSQSSRVNDLCNLFFFLSFFSFQSSSVNDLCNFYCWHYSDEMKSSTLRKTIKWQMNVLFAFEQSLPLNAGEMNYFIIYTAIYTHTHVPPDQEVFIHHLKVSK